MSQPTTSRADVEKVRDLFGLSHDLIAQATFPGHVAGKVQDALQFLAWQYNDFKVRSEALAKAEAPAIPVVEANASIPGEAVIAVEAETKPA